VDRELAFGLVSMERPVRSAGNSTWVIHDGADGATFGRSRPCPSVAHLGPIHLGLDVHKDTISAASLAHDRDGPDMERIAHDEASIPPTTQPVTTAA
jgi:hypothetical protein